MTSINDPLIKGEESNNNNNNNNNRTHIDVLIDKKEEKVIETPIHEIIGFIIAGSLNHLSYWILLAGAKEIAADNVGLVYASSTGPTVIIKITGPYWYHLLSYKSRVLLSALLRIAAFILVAAFMTSNLPLTLLGVMLGAAAHGIGECSFLALTAFYSNPRTCITSWAAGSGTTGLLGYAYVVFFTYGLEETFRFSLIVGLIFPILYYLNFIYVLGTPTLNRDLEVEEEDDDEVEYKANNDEENLITGHNESDQSPILVSSSSNNATITNNNNTNIVRRRSSNNQRNRSHSRSTSFANNPSSVVSSIPSSFGQKEGEDAALLEEKAVTLTTQERFNVVLSLWYLILPLGLTFAAEYLMMGGVWAAMGFPIDDSNARADFYMFANFTYQLGAMLSRSSSSLFALTISQIQSIPVFQIGFMIVFIMNAFYKWWMDWGILTLCFVVGLLGGAVYSHGFAYLSENIEPSLREFSLSAAAVGDSVGALCGEISGLFVQKALYDYHNLSDDDG